MNELQEFSFKGKEVRSLVIENEPWFVGKDVAEVLGYKNTRDALSKHIDKEDKKDGVAVHDTMGRIQNPIVINESGLYSLILSSKLQLVKYYRQLEKPEATTVKILKLIQCHY